MQNKPDDMIAFKKDELNAHLNQPSTQRDKERDVWLGQWFSYMNENLEEQNRHLRSISIAVNVLTVLLMLLFILGACSVLL